MVERESIFLSGGNTIIDIIHAMGAQLTAPLLDSDSKQMRNCRGESSRPVFDLLFCFLNALAPLAYANTRQKRVKLIYVFRYRYSLPFFPRHDLFPPRFSFFSLALANTMLVDLLIDLFTVKFRF